MCDVFAFLLCVPIHASDQVTREQLKLFWSSTSPFVRKVRVTAREKGVDAHIEEIECNPFANPSSLRARNPIGKVPTLVTATHGAIYDSPVICAYLDTLSGAPMLYPAREDERWQVRRAEALADGILDIAVGITLELRRTPELQSSSVIDRGRKAVLASLDEMERQLRQLPGPLTAGHIAFACVCGYLDFRNASLGSDWRAPRPALSAWYSEFGGRRSMQATAHSNETSTKFPA